MISLNTCASILNKKGKSYSPKQIKELMELLYRAAELEYKLFKSMEMESKIYIERWEDISKDFHKVYRLIHNYRILGIEIASKAQPLNLNHTFWYARLMTYILQVDCEEHES